MAQPVSLNRESVSHVPPPTDVGTSSHAAAVRMPIAGIVAYLKDALGLTLTAHIANVAETRTVGDWATGKRTPQPSSEQRLRATFQIMHLILERESMHVLRPWLIGHNPQLGDEAPADVLREGRTADVLAAARAFTAGG